MDLGRSLLMNLSYVLLRECLPSSYAINGKGMTINQDAVSSLCMQGFPKPERQAGS